MGASLITQSVKNLTTMQESQVRFLGWEDPLKEEIATCSSILAWRIPWTEEPGRLQSMGSTRVGHDLATKPTKQPTMKIEKTKLAWEQYYNKIFLSLYTISQVARSLKYFLLWVWRKTKALIRNPIFNPYPWFGVALRQKRKFTDLSGCWEDPLEEKG